MYEASLIANTPTEFRYHFQLNNDIIYVAKYHNDVFSIESPFPGSSQFCKVFALVRSRVCSHQFITVIQILYKYRHALHNFHPFTSTIAA